MKRIDCGVEAVPSGPQSGVTVATLRDCSWPLLKKVIIVELCCSCTQVSMWCTGSVLVSA